MKNKASLPYALQSMLLWGCMPVLWTFLPIYLAQQEMDAGRIGIIMAMNPLMALLIQPVFGPVADRSRSKNRLFSLLMAGTVLCILIIPLGGSFAYIVAVVAALSLAQIPTIPISESISLESLDRINRSYGPVRMTGTVGFSLVSILVGYAAEWNIRSMFFITALIGILSIFVTEKLPTVEGHQSSDRKIPFWEVFRDNRLKVFVPLSVIAQITLAFYMTYLPMYFTGIGGDRGQLGWIYFIMGAGEIPFLMFADRIIEKLGIQRALGISVAVMGLRFLALFFIAEPGWMFLVSAFNGLTFIIFGFGLAVFMSRTVRKELRTTGQSVLALAGALGRVIGSLSGGFIITVYGLRHAMGLYAGLCFATLALYILALRFIGKSGTPAPVPPVGAAVDPVETLDRIMNTETFE